MFATSVRYRVGYVPDRLRKIIRFASIDSMVWNDTDEILWEGSVYADALACKEFCVN